MFFFFFDLLNEWESCFRKYSPTLFRDCPWLLLIGIVYERITRNCLHFNLNGHFDRDGFKTILGINTLFLALLPLKTLASMTWFTYSVIISLVPLHKLVVWSTFLIGIICTPIFSWSLWFDNLEHWRPFKTLGINRLT